MGRTGTLHACDQEGVAPDLMTVAKGLGGGYAPIGAVLARGEIIDAIAAVSGTFVHGQTYNGHPLACAAALAVQETIRQENLLANVRTQGDRLTSRLRAAFNEHDFVGDIRGRGLLQAIELVFDKETKAPFPRGHRAAGRIKKAAMELGLLIYPGTGCADGKAGDHVLIAPPFNVSEEAIDLFVDRLAVAVDAAIETVLKELRNGPVA
jgi:adenosylmethionine-8-amino-7-oxononanoate aminotransferase